MKRLRKVGWIVLLAACGELVNPNCTQKGCLEGLSLEVSGDVPEAFTVRLEQVFPAPWQVECTPATCAPRISFEDFTPSYVVVAIESSGEVLFREAFEPEYERVFPNGPQCDEGCLHATIEVVLQR